MAGDSKYIIFWTCRLLMPATWQVLSVSLSLELAPEFSVLSILHVDAREVRQHYYWNNRKNMTRSVSLYISQTLLRLKFAPAELSVSSILHVDAREVRQHYYWKEIWKHDKDMLGGLYKIPTATWSRHKFYIQLMDASYKGSGQKYFGGGGVKTVPSGGQKSWHIQGGNIQFNSPIINE